MIPQTFSPVVATLACVILVHVPTEAQQVAVQQPEFRQFAAPATVMVPDRGAAFLGGVARGGRGQVMNGPVPMSRSAAVSGGASSVQVRAYVHDFQAMDEAILGEERRPATTAPVRPEARSPFRGLPRRQAAGQTLPVSHLRTEVEAALMAEANAESIADQGAAIRALVRLHDEIVADRRFPTSVTVRGLARSVATRLVHAHDTLKETATGGNAADAQALIDLIQATIRPETWNVNGGRGSIVYFANGHALVVSAPGDAHDDLEGLLRQLR